MTEAVTQASAKAAAVKYFASDAAVMVSCVPGEKVLHDVPRSPADTDADVKITNPYTAEFEEGAGVAQDRSRRLVLCLLCICRCRHCSPWTMD